MQKPRARIGQNLLPWCGATLLERQTPTGPHISSAMSSEQKRKSGQKTLHGDKMLIGKQHLQWSNSLAAPNTQLAMRSPHQAAKIRVLKKIAFIQNDLASEYFPLQ
jgi:hypothetical protein